MKHDVIVLGAGMVGVSCALHLQRKNLSVAVLDRRAPGLETSFGNAGLIQREAIAPYEMPRGLAFLLSGLLNRRIDVQYHTNAVLRTLGPLWAYFRNSAPQRYRRIAREYETLIALCIETHDELMREADDARALIGATGYLNVFRTELELHEGFAIADERARLGVNHVKLTGAQIAALEPALKTRFAGAVHWTDPLAIKHPGALVQAYARLFERNGGQLAVGDAMTLARNSAGGWQVRADDGTLIEAPRVVIALGPWTTRLTARFGYAPPLFAKRGYHMHYALAGEQPLNNWVMDAEKGYLVCPMQAGLRLTTGAELADVNAPRTPRQLALAESVARQSFPLGERLDAEPWVGARPCMPDMKPVFGRVPGQTDLWCAFGHGHQGFTLGPITGELLAAMMTDAPTRVDVQPFTPTRFA